MKLASPEDDKYQSGDADEEETENSEEESDEGRGDSSLSTKEASEDYHRSKQAASRVWHPIIQGSTVRKARKRVR